MHQSPSNATTPQARRVDEIEQSEISRPDLQPLLTDVLPLVASFLEQRLVRTAKLGSVNYLVPSWSRGQDVHNFRLVCKDWSVVSPKYVSDHPADKESYLTVKALEVVANALHQHDKIAQSVREYEWANERNPCEYNKLPQPALQDEPVTYTYCENDDVNPLDAEELCDGAMDDLDGYTDELVELYEELDGSTSTTVLIRFKPIIKWTKNIHFILEAKKKYPHNALFALELATFNERSMARAFDMFTSLGPNQPLHTESQNNSI